MAHNHRKVPIVYCTPIFQNILVIHLLSAFSSDPDPKYLILGTQQRFVPVPRAFIAYQAHRAFSKYLVDSVQMPVIYEIAEAIDTLIPEHFHLPLSMDKYSPIQISPFNVVAKMPRTSSDNQQVFLQCVLHTTFGTIFGLSLLDISINFSGFCNRVPHLLYAKPIELVAEDLASRLLTDDAISEVSQYEFNTKELLVTPKQLKLPSNEENYTGIAGP